MRRTYRRTRLLAALALAVAGAAAVATTPAEAPSPGLDYVALGDSYSAGPLIPRQRLEAGLCLRSDHNYPSLLARRLHVTSFRDVTCTGAESKDLSRPVHTGLPGPPSPPQLAALDRGTDLVTLGIGGNDDGLFSALFRTCPRLARRDPDGAPCRDAYTDDDGTDELAAKVDHVRAHLRTLLRRIRARAPKAEVWVVGYPRVLPADGTCRAIPLAAGDYRWADRIERTLNTALQSTAALDGAHFADTYAASTGHDACAGPDAWINGSVESLRRAAAYHPLRSGMEAEARLLQGLIGTGDGAAPALGASG
ncbi:SGNH/GDSL hydrolase family protein [Nocardioides panaciterrulae]|uniref:Lysophospholipase L1-like esterase n=1 Tax=Nocardioides panaciterrulae TaxID=661492 RepID=A0A7Y9E596_9ACTN|nr:lysophospholipase L1-like esterase [Nocardioides panaciterrulae]